MKNKRGLFFLLGLVLCGNAFAADPGAVAKQAGAWRAQHEREILEEFSSLLAIPNLANDQPNIQRNAELIVAMLKKRGLTTQLLTVEGAPPIVVGDLVVPEAKRTIAFYAHYDGQPVDPTKWKSEPWQPVMRDRAGNDVDWREAKKIDPEWRLYARSAGDDKAPIIGIVAALDALRASGVQPSVNLRFVFEGEEEAGSPHLAQYLQKYPKVLRPGCLGALRRSGPSKPEGGTFLRRARGGGSRAHGLRAGQGLARRPLRKLGAKPDR